MNRIEILDRAADIVNGERQEQYDEVGRAWRMNTTT